MVKADAKWSKPVIGLLGGIGAGKTKVGRLFASLGAAVIDADRQAHDELSKPEVVAVLRSWWGDRVLRTPRPGGLHSASDCGAGDCGCVDRGAVASIVFSKPEELSRLTRLLYPRLHELRCAMMQRYEADSTVKAVVWDAPMLVEAGLHEDCDALVFIDADRSTRIARVQATRGWSVDEWESRENQQKPLDIKKTMADYIVKNHSDTGDLCQQVEQVFSSVLAAYSRSGTPRSSR